MPSVVLISGTGVREKGYNQMLAVVRSRMHLARANYAVQECRWYEKYGTPDPPYASAPLNSDFRSVDDSPLDEDVLAWQALYLDPLFELRRLSGEKDLASGRPDAAADLAEKLFQVARPDSMKDETQWPFLESWPTACTTIFEDDVTKEAVASSASSNDAANTVARALVAELIRIGVEQDMLLPDGVQRDIWVRDLRNNMGFEDEVDDRDVPKAFTPLTRLLNRAVIRPFGESRSPIAGDIIYYQTRGDNIRSVIADAIVSAPPPVYVLAHSLGGIAAVDTLVLRKDLKVAALITFGSQAPFFHEIGALVSLDRKSAALPPHFPDTWCNVFDPNDLLSFRAQPIFPNDKRVKDHSLDSGQPPLAAHSSYLPSHDFWKIVFDVIPHVN